MKNNKSLANIVALLLVLVALMEIGHLFFVSKEIQELGSMAVEDTYASIYEYQDRMRGMEVYAFLSNMIELTAIITFLVWFYNANANLGKAGILYIRHSNAFAVWAWIIPVLNFFKPYQLTKEIVGKSQMKIKELTPEYVPQSLNKLINSCWALFIIHSVLSLGVFIWAVSNNSLATGLMTLQAGIVLSVVLMIYILLLAYMVYRVSQIEEKLFKAVNTDN